MRALLWRLLYAVICVFLFWWIMPLFLQVLGVPLPANVFALLHVVVAALAILYVFFGPTPPAPF